eukprot:CAMPEP_0114591564 /NCGR_PEP_ID=MMETSP0125-20121206/13571_1 /TAXON_ID=485358 ORGANISM="Aristerostoma sp., Strain ATCC 50986" /NCGR_SAMPLE_ID=MMETSP0125 /ASSEMBLY_ACC=CAM_ASM_000245 /LENGTH=73 /DNA_ID=CAMNT_0001789695 /DNA_START=388 /DNA_END=609 /DNA_ORIENTATION=+
MAAPQADVPDKWNLEVEEVVTRAIEVEKNILKQNWRKKNEMQNKQKQDSNETVVVGDKGVSKAQDSDRGSETR